MLDDIKLYLREESTLFWYYSIQFNAVQFNSIQYYIVIVNIAPNINCENQF